MGFHIHIRGELEYASPEEAAAAHRALTSGGDWPLELGTRVTDNVIAVSFENFVGDPQATIDRLFTAAETAVAGKVLYDDEAGEHLHIAANAVGIGAAPAAGEYLEEVRLAGSWTFASEDDARNAFEVIAAALVRFPARALSRKKNVVRLSYDGLGDLRTIYAVKLALFALAPRAVSGCMRHRQQSGGLTSIEAPLSPLDDGTGERRYLRVFGFVSFRDQHARDAAFSSVSKLGAVAKRARQLALDAQGTIAAERLPAIEATLDAMMATAVQGSLYLHTSDRCRTLYSR